MNAFEFVIRATQLISTSHTQGAWVHTLESRTARCVSSRNATRGCRAVQRGSLSSGTTRLCILFPFQKITYEITIFLEISSKKKNRKSQS